MPNKSRFHFPSFRRAPETVEDPEPAGPAWHAEDVERVFGTLETTGNGHSADEVERRRAVSGPNRLPAAPRRGPLLRLLSQFHNVLIYVLLAAAVLAFALEHGIDAGVILGVVVINAIIGFIQEGRAEQALDAIRGMIDPQASVIRDGRRITVPAEDLVPGDVVIVEAGDRVPADLRLIRARNLKIEEAVLTGESVAVEKGTAPVEPGVALGDRSSMAYSGTFVTTGMGTGIVVATGVATELGHISRLLGAVATLKTPLVRQMDSFARQLSIGILAIALGAFAFAYLFRGYSVADGFMAVVGLAVAAIPEGLPAIMTITLAIGVKRMAERNAIIRRLPAVETLGSVSVICSDKTGTLTKNEMTARSVATAELTYEVGGVGYTPEGDFSLDGNAVLPSEDAILMKVLHAGLLCNDADIRETDGAWRTDGDPMEGALVSLAMKAGHDPGHSRQRLPRTEEIPFDSQHRFMATLHHAADGDAFILIKGAPERVIDMCAMELTADGERPIDRARWHDRAEGFARRGERLLAFAVKPVATEQRSLGFDDVAEGAALLGCVGFIDPPRAEAVEAIRECHGAGIRVAMITGDHAVTAREIACELGLNETPKVLRGADLDDLDDNALGRAAQEADVFARTTPEHKLRLVQALQAGGHTVAMTGDGVNDAPALKRADVGVAMGRKGSEAAKEAAEMVLVDDNFATIVAAVREGRTVYDNLMKVIAWTLPTNGGEGLTILAAIMLGLTLPVTPAQLLWVNMITAVTLGLTLAFEPTEPNAMRRPPRITKQGILSGVLLWQVAFVSVLFVCGGFGIFYWAESRGLPIETARTLVVNTLVVMEIFYLFSVRYVHGTSLTWRGVLGTPAVLMGVGAVTAAQFAFTYLPWMQFVFQSRPISFTDGLTVVGVGVCVLIVVEIEKAVRWRLVRKKQPPGTS